MNSSFNPKLTALSLAQGLGITSAVISVNVSGLAGAQLCAIPHLATLPYGLQFAATIAAAMPIARLTERFGRRPVFIAGGGCGVLGGLAGFVAIEQASFFILCAAHVLMGAQLATVNLYRFAAADVAREGQQSSAMSLVLLGGVFAALAGPWIARNAWLYLPSNIFGAAYLAVAAVAVFGAVLIACVAIPKAAAPTLNEAKERFSGNRGFWLALAAGATVYGFMNMLMIAASLEMTARDYDFNLVSYLIQAHVLAMFLPALITGKLIARFGVTSILIAGCGLMIASGLAGLFPVPSGFALALLFLGLGWNALYTAGSVLVTSSLDARALYRGQGINETGVAIMATIGALGSAGLLAVLGWERLNLIMMAVMLALLFAVFKERRVGMRKVG
jgi:MFS family permease